MWKKFGICELTQQHCQCEYHSVIAAYVPLSLFRPNRLWNCGHKPRGTKRSIMSLLYGSQIVWNLGDSGYFVWSRSYGLQYRVVWWSQPTFRRNISPPFFKVEEEAKQGTSKKEEENCLPPASCWFLTWLTNRPWKWRLNIPPKRMDFFRTTRCYNPEDHTLYSHRSENSNTTCHSLWSVCNFRYATDFFLFPILCAIIIPLTSISPVCLSLFACTLWRSLRETIGMVAITPSGTPQTEGWVK
jgi:hypothetical protein